MKHYLVLSFSRLLERVYRNPSLLEDLPDAMFVFGATRENPGDLLAGRAAKKDWMKRLSESELEYLIRSMEEFLDHKVHPDRVSWRPNNEFATYERLADMLSRHGFPVTAQQLEQLPADPTGGGDRAAYSTRMNPRIKAFLEGLLPNLEVIA